MNKLGQIVGAIILVTVLGITLKVVSADVLTWGMYLLFSLAFVTVAVVSKHALDD